ncbi:DUF507 family protein [Rickettsia endosymbiont of Rhinocyllus conicus]|uniref:DUF507 family protein n=1 Tax=Rickettsia endosymbiont of Rhinocyllus conicus TaxID=3066252 RepID=UPI003133096D
MKKKLKNIFKINKKEKVKDNIPTETIINLPEDKTTKGKNKKDKTYDYEKLKQKLFKISEKALQKNNDLDKIFKALAEDKKLKAGYKGVKFIFKNPKLAISTLKTIPSLVNDIKKIEEIFLNKDEKSKLENQSFLLKLIEDPDSVAFLEKNKEVIKTTISKILPNALKFALKNDKKVTRALTPLIHQILDKCFDDPKNFMTIANLAVKFTLKTNSKDHIQQLFNKINVTPILKDLGVFLSQDDKIGNLLAEIITTNIKSNNTIKQTFLKNVSNLDILQDATPIISKLIGKILENETDTNKLHEALKPIIFSDFKEKLIAASDIEQIKQLDKEETNKYLNVAKILSSPLIKSEIFPTIQELITVLHKHKSTTQTIISNSIAIFSKDNEESARKLSETNKTLDHNQSLSSER